MILSHRPFVTSLEHLVRSIGFLHRVQLGILTDQLCCGFVELVIALARPVPRNLSCRTTVRSGSSQPLAHPSTRTQPLIISVPVEMNLSLAPPGWLPDPLGDSPWDSPCAPHGRTSSSGLYSGMSSLIFWSSAFAFTAHSHACILHNALNLGLTVSGDVSRMARSVSSRLIWIKPSADERSSSHLASWSCPTFLIMLSSSLTSCSRRCTVLSDCPPGPSDASTDSATVPPTP